MTMALLSIFLIAYLPYYLWRTRGFKGLVILAGFLLLFLLGPLFEIGEYFWRAA